MSCLLLLLLLLLHCWLVAWLYFMSVSKGVAVAANVFCQTTHFHVWIQHFPFTPIGSKINIVLLLFLIFCIHPCHVLNCQHSVRTYCDLIAEQFHVLVMTISITHVYWEVDVPLSVHAIGTPPSPSTTVCITFTAPSSASLCKYLKWFFKWIIRGSLSLIAWLLLFLLPYDVEWSHWLMHVGLIETGYVQYPSPNTTPLYTAYELVLHRGHPPCARTKFHCTAGSTKHVWAHFSFLQQTGTNPK